MTKKNYLKSFGALLTNILKVRREIALQAGNFMVKEEAIKGLSPVEIQKKYSLKHPPTHISDVEVPADTLIQRGIVESNFGGRAGAVQYELLNKSAAKNYESWFTNMRKLK